MSWISTYLRSSVGAKHLMAATGALLALFAIGHMIGNLLVFAGPDALNAYGAKLRSFGPLLWVVRLGLLVAVALHIGTGMSLARANHGARPVPYAKFTPVRTTPFARSMPFSGLMLLAFVVYHLLHFTFGVLEPETASLVDGEGRHDIYAMVVAGFGRPAVVGSYLVAMVMLAMHLAHGGSSVFQSVGLRHTKYDRCVELVGPALALALLLGNAAMPIAVFLGLLPEAGGLP